MKFHALESISTSSTTCSIAAPAPLESLAAAEPRSPLLAFRDVAEATAEALDVAEATPEALDVDEVLRLFARGILGLLAVSRCSIFMLDPANGHYQGRVVEPTSRSDDPIKGVSIITEQDGFGYEVVTTRRPVLVTDVQRDPRTARCAMRNWAAKSLLGVPMIARDEVIGIVVVDNGNFPHGLTADKKETAAAFVNLAGHWILHAARVCELRSTVADLTRKNELLRCRALIDQRLTRLLTDAAGLQEMLATVTDLSGKPCNLYGPDLRPLVAQCGPRRSSVFWDLAAQPETAEAVGHLTTDRPELIGPFPTIGLPRRLLVVRVTVQDATCGYLVLEEARTRFSMLDHVVAARAAAAIAVAFAARRRTADAENHAREVLVRDLIHGADGGQRVVRRAEFLGLRVGAPYVVCHLRRGDPALAAITPDEFGRAAAGCEFAYFPGTAMSESGSLVLFAELNRDLAPLKAVAEAKLRIGTVVDGLATDVPIFVALSSPCTSLADFRRGHDEAHQVMRCLLNLTPGSDRVEPLSADDLGAGRILLAGADSREADRFVGDTLANLAFGSDTATIVLRETLQAFLDCNTNLRRTGARLRVHENTIRYRLTRVAELTGLNVMTSKDDQLRVHVALLIMRIAQGRSAAAGRDEDGHRDQGTTLESLDRVALRSATSD
jgi:sugar diacid utilization regulator